MIASTSLNGATSVSAVNVAGTPALSGSPSVATSLLGNNVALPGYDPYTPGNAIPFGGPQNFIGAYEDLTYVRGKHSLAIVDSTLA